MFEAIQHFTGTDISKMEEDELRKTATKLGVDLDPTMGKGKDHRRDLRAALRAETDPADIHYRLPRGDVASGQETPQQAGTGRTF